MNKRSDGFILGMTLCVILVITLLILACMQHVLLLNKAMNRQEREHQVFYEIEDVAVQLAQTQFNQLEKQCISHDKTANQAINMLFRNEGCSFKAGHNLYQYIIEDLGEFPCLVLHHNDQKRSTHHSRITLLLLSKEEYAVSKVVQIRYINASDLYTCEGQEHVVFTGVSSWRYFPDYPKEHTNKAKSTIA
jgi:hypothetical protein